VHPGIAMPLLVGLADTAAVRRSADGGIALLRLDGTPFSPDGETGPTLEELAARRTAGGGMLDSIANMANSILGAGP
jgi:sodium-coupled neutral amino acid transporter 11